MSTRHKHPEGALCAAGGFYPPLQFGWGSCAIQRTALSRQVSGGCYPPLPRVSRLTALLLRSMIALQVNPVILFEVKFFEVEYHV